MVIREPEVRVVEAVDPSGPVVASLEPTPSLEEGLYEVVHDVEAQLIERALRQCDGVKMRAAGLLGMKYSTFWDLADRRGVEVDGSEGAPSVGLDEVDRVDVTVPRAAAAPVVLELPVDRDEGLLSSVVDGCRRELVQRALDAADGRLNRAAARLGVKYTTFYSLVKRLKVRTVDDGDSAESGGKATSR